MEFLYVRLRRHGVVVAANPAFGSREFEDSRFKNGIQRPGRPEIRNPGLKLSDGRGCAVGRGGLCLGCGDSRDCPDVWQSGQGAFAVEGCGAEAGRFEFAMAFRGDRARDAREVFLLRGGGGPIVGQTAG
jgi:hypothetical protein